MKLLLQADCTRPYYQYLADAVSNPQNLFQWPFCPYVDTGLGFTGVGLFIVATAFIGIKHWSEGWTLPLTYLALVLPVLGATLLPGTAVRQFAGIVTVAFSLLFLGIWWWWGRS